MEQDFSGNWTKNETIIKNSKENMYLFSLLQVSIFKKIKKEYNQVCSADYRDNVC